MSRFLSLSIYIAASLLCSCERQIPDGAYRVEVKKISSQSTSMTRKYEIETASLRKVVLADQSGSNSTSIGPDSMTDDRTGRAEAVVTVELQELGARARVTVKMEVKTESISARSEKTLAVPGATDLSSILTEDELTGDLTSATTLLRLSSGGGYLQITIE